MPSELVLGVDAGNSKTVALLADRTGAVLGRGRAGIGDIYAGTAEDAVAEVKSAVEQALDRAGATLSSVGHAAFRLAGVDWAEDKTFWDDVARTQFHGLRSWSVKNDGYALLRFGQLSGVGVSVTAGSGPAVAARGRAGQEFTAGWWIHHSLGGRGLGDAAFRAVLSAELEIGPGTVLTERMLALFGVAEVETLVHEFTRRENARPDRQKWGVARAVLQSAEEGDLVALAIVHAQAEGLAAYAGVAARRVGFSAADRVTVVIGGSILASEHQIVRDLLVARIDEVMNATVQLAAGSPVDGALLDALAESGVVTDDQLRHRILTTPHPPDFLQT